MKTTLCLCAWVIGAVLLCSLGWSETFIVEGGNPRAEIIVAEQPARMTKLAAANLQEYILKMTGAELAITNAPTAAPVTIYVGKSAYTDKLGLSTNGLNHGAYRMASGPTWLALLGPDNDYAPRVVPKRDRGYIPKLDVRLRDDGGTMNAVCDFLRDLGVRWYFPGELGEAVPKKASIRLPSVNRTATPDFPYRLPSYWYGHVWPDVALWTLRLGGFAGQEIHGTRQICHGLKWIIMEDEVKQQHPEWYALWGGKRATDHSYSGAPCLANEELFQRHVRFAQKMFDVNNEPMLSLDLPDGAGRPCKCRLCAGKDTPERGWSGAMSDYVSEYINRVANELYKTHPERKVSALSYSAYTLAPEEVGRLSPNIVLWMCQWRSRFHDRAARTQALDLRRAWLEVLSSREIYIYEYYLHNYARYGYEGIPVYYPHLIAEDLHSLRGVSGGELIEVYLHRDRPDFAWHPLAVTHLNIYVTLRLLWDTDQDVDAMLDEFYERFYGSAAGPMKTLIEYCETDWPEMRMDVRSIDRALALLAEAEAAVDSHSVCGRRVAIVATYLDLLRARKEKLATYRQDVPVVRSPARANGGLLIDGRLEEPFWSGLPRHELRDVETGEPVEAKTSFQAAWNEGDRSLVFGIRCEEPEMKDLVTGATQNGDPSLFNDDAIELFLETPFHAFYQIVVNTRGLLMDLDRKDGLNSLWSSEAEVAAFRHDGGWNLEIKIPTADHVGGGFDPMKRVNGAKPTPTEPWYFNLCRNRPRGKQSELSVFSPTGTRRFGDPSKFGMLHVQ